MLSRLLAWLRRLFETPDSTQQLLNEWFDEGLRAIDADWQEQRRRYAMQPARLRRAYWRECAADDALLEEPDGPSHP